MSLPLQLRELIYEYLEDGITIRRLLHDNHKESKIIINSIMYIDATNNTEFFKKQHIINKFPYLRNIYCEDETTLIFVNGVDELQDISPDIEYLYLFISKGNPLDILLTTKHPKCEISITTISDFSYFYIISTILYMQNINNMTHDHIKIFKKYQIKSIRINNCNIDFAIIKELIETCKISKVFTYFDNERPMKNIFALKEIIEIDVLSEIYPFHEEEKYPNILKVITNRRHNKEKIISTFPNVKEIIII